MKGTRVIMKNLTIASMLCLLGCGPGVSPADAGEDVLRRVETGVCDGCLPTASPLPGHEGVDIDGDYVDPIRTSKEDSGTDADASN